MAKASAQITLHYVIDVKAAYRYYLLQSSTAAKPSKPTIWPPSAEGPLFTNLVDSATDDNGNIYNETGYKDDYRWSASAGAEASNSGARITGWMPFTSGATYRFRNFDMDTRAYVGYGYFIAKKNDGTITATAIYGTSEFNYTYDSNTDTCSITYTNSAVAYFRISAYKGVGLPIITCNEEIAYGVQPNNWDDTEPTYVEGSTNSLYFVDCTVFADDSYSYTDVSLSSSYEAAKLAYNKATAAQSAATTAQSAAATAKAVAEAAKEAVNVATDVIVGTQTAATNDWTGVAKFSSLTDGQQIVYWLPYAGTSSSATLNLTLADGTETGAKNCYYTGTTRLTTHYAAGSMIRFVYKTNISIAGSSTTYTGWWADANYVGSDTYDRIRYYKAIKCGTTAIVKYNIIVGTGGVYKHLKAGTAFDITYPILYASAAIAASGTSTNAYICYPMTITTTQSITLTAYKPVYIKGTLEGTMFTPVSTTPLTQTTPTSDDGYDYILLGHAYSTTGMYLLSEHPIFTYYNGAFKSFDQIAAEAAIAAKNLEDDLETNYYTKTETDTNIEKLEESINLTVDTLTTTVSEQGTEINTLKSNQLTLSDDFTGFVENTTKKITDIETGKVSVEEIREWARFDGAQLELGTSDSPFKAILTNTELGFWQGDEMIAWISNQSLQTVYAIITTSIGCGNFTFVDEGDLGFSLI